MDRHAPIPEALLTLCRSGPAPAADVSDAEWPRLVERAERERVAGLVARAVRRGRVVRSVPRGAAIRLERAASRNTARGIWERAVLSEAIDALDRAGVDAVVLRGQPLVDALYEGDTSLRDQVDHDVLVTPRARETAARALERIGFARHPALRHQLVRDGSIVDLHDAPLDRGRIAARHRGSSLDAAAVIDRARSARIDGREILTPGRADGVVLLSAHLVEHSFDRLFRTVDLARAWDTAEIDGDLAIEHAAACDLLPELALAARVASRLLDARLPAELRELEIPSVGRLGDRAVAHALAGCASPYLAEWWLLGRARSWSERLRAVGELLWPADGPALTGIDGPRGFVAAVRARVGHVRGALASRPAQPGRS